MSLHFHRAGRLILFASSLMSCGGFDECRIGDLEGQWLLRYSETRGNCGPLPDVLFVGMPIPDDANCVVNSAEISSDQCRLSSNVTCPTSDNRGTVVISHVVDQTAANLLEGICTVQLTHVEGNCSSTYDAEVERL